MKLESLNNSKYSLTPEKMGKLIGGSVCCEPSNGGNYGSTTNYSCDVVFHYSGDDIPLDKNGQPKPTLISPLAGKSDMQNQSLLISQNGGLCK